MSQINGTFLYLDRPTNGATAKLWLKAGHGTPPAKDAAEPDGAYKVGATLTTGTAYGGDGGYRWDGVDEGEYYVSCYYASQRFWYFMGFLAFAVLTTQGDILIRGASVPERLAKGTDGQTLTMVSGSPAWA